MRRVLSRVLGQEQCVNEGPTSTNAIPHLAQIGASMCSRAEEVFITCRDLLSEMLLVTLQPPAHAIRIKANTVQSKHDFTTEIGLLLF